MLASAGFSVNHFMRLKEMGEERRNQQIEDRLSLLSALRKCHHFECMHSHNTTSHMNDTNNAE